MKIIQRGNLVVTAGPMGGRSQVVLHGWGIDPEGQDPSTMPDLPMVLLQAVLLDIAAEHGIRLEGGSGEAAAPLTVERDAAAVIDKARGQR